MEKTINESKYVSRVKSIRKDAENLLGSASQLVGAVGGNELDQMVSGALDAASNLIAFAYYFLEDGTVTKMDVMGNYTKVIKAANKLSLTESITTETEIYIDPYESEYLPAEMLSENRVEIKESINEDNDPLPDDLDDDPDAVFTTDPNGMPVKFNNTPVELDPFAVKLFRNNSELVDPPEVFNAEQGVDVAPEIDVPVSDTAIDTVISAVADAPVDSAVEKSDIPELSVELPSDDFDVFAKESKVITSKVTPKESKSILPPQFEAKRANENIAEEPGNNLKMLSFLAQDW